MQFLWFILLGACAGWLAGQIARGHGFGLIGNIIVGILGALIGGWLAPRLGIRYYGILGSLLVSAGGAVLLLLVLGLFSRKN